MRHDGEHASGDVRRGHRGASGRGAAGRAAAGRAAAGGLLAVGLVVVPAWAPVWTPHSTHSTLSWAPVGSAVAATANQDEECPAGVLIPERGWAPDALALDAAHRIATGAGVRVAVIDSGVAPVAHLRGALAIGTDVVGGEGADATGQTDLTGHGTVVATMVAARPLEGSGLVGVAPGAQILPVRAWYADDDAAQRDGTAPTPQSLAAGLRAAVALGADIAVVAASTAEDAADLRDAVAQASAAGVLVVASAGNLADDDDPTQPRYPGAYPGVLAVAAMADGLVPVAAHTGPHVAIAGPGALVLGGLPNGADCVLGADGNATSWATAQVAGAAALLAQAYPDEGPEGWVFRLTATAARQDPDARSDDVGWGLVQPLAALTLVDDGTARGVDSPAVARPEPAADDEPPLHVTVPPDTWLPARQAVLWWSLAAAVAWAAVVLVGRRRGPAAPRALRR